MTSEGIPEPKVRQHGDVIPLECELTQKDFNAFLESQAGKNLVSIVGQQEGYALEPHYSAYSGVVMYNSRQEVGSIECRVNSLIGSQTEGIIEGPRLQVACQNSDPFVLNIFSYFIQDFQTFLEQKKKGFWLDPRYIIQCVRKLLKE